MTDPTPAPPTPPPLGDDATLDLGPVADRATDAGTTPAPASVDGQFPNLSGANRPEAIDLTPAAVPEAPPAAVRAAGGPAAPLTLAAPPAFPPPSPVAFPAAALPAAEPAAAPAPLVAKRPEWKVLEPDDRTDPTQHEVYEADLVHAEWQVVAASVRGKLHAHKGQWREDSYRWGTADGWTVLAVSDGAGSARLSRVGSRVACDAAVAHLQGLLSGYTLVAGEQDAAQPAQSDLGRVREFLKSAAEKARFAVLAEARARAAPVSDFSATLLLAVVAPWAGRHLVAVLQAGDGAVGVCSADGVKRLGFADHGEYSSETRFLTTPGMELEYANRVVFTLPAGLTALALMTDGVSDDFYPEDTRIGELFAPGPIAGLAALGGGPVPGLLAGVAAEPRGGEALRDWLRYEKRGSSDDRTLILLHRSRP